jgi:hypothetical protein
MYMSIHNQVGARRANAEDHDSGRNRRHTYVHMYYIILYTKVRSQPDGRLQHYSTIVNRRTGTGVAHAQPAVAVPKTVKKLSYVPVAE